MRLLTFFLSWNFAVDGDVTLVLASDLPLVNGQQACEGRGLTESECDGLGCCNWSNGQCWSGVGDEPCGIAVMASAFGLRGQTACQDRGYSETECTNVGCCSWNEDKCWSDIGNNICGIDWTHEDIGREDEAKWDSPPGISGHHEHPDETHSSLPNCPDPDSVGIPEGCDPESTTADNLDKCLPQKALIFGISIRGAADVPDWAFTYASNVLAQYLDSDMDGVADDDKLVAALQSSGGWF